MFAMFAFKVAVTVAMVRGIAPHGNTLTTPLAWIADTRIQFRCVQTHAELFSP